MYWFFSFFDYVSVDIANFANLQIVVQKEKENKSILHLLPFIYLQRGCGWQLLMKDKNSVNNVTNPMAKNPNSVISTFTFIDSLNTIVNVSVILKRKSNFSTLLRSEKN